MFSEWPPTCPKVCKDMSKLCKFQGPNQRSGVFLLVAVLLVAGCSRSPQEKYSEFVGLGQKQSAAGDFNRAILSYRNALLAQPDNADGHYQLALAYLGARKLPEGIL